MLLIGDDKLFKQNVDFKVICYQKFQCSQDIKLPFSSSVMPTDVMPICASVAVDSSRSDLIFCQTRSRNPNEFETFTLRKFAGGFRSTHDQETRLRAKFRNLAC